MTQCQRCGGLELFELHRGPEGWYYCPSLDFSPCLDDTDTARHERIRADNEYVKHGGLS